MSEQSTFEKWLHDLFEGELKEVSYSETRIDEAELQRLGANSPAVTIFCQGSRDYENTGRGTRHKQIMTAFVIVGDCCGESKAQTAKRIALKIADNLPRAKTDHVHSVELPTISTTSLTTSGIDEMGLSLWGISWQQIVLNKMEL